MPAQGDKPVKKEEAEDEEENISLSSFRKKSVNGSAESRPKVAKVKKEEPSEDGDVSEVRRSLKKVVKEEEVDDGEDEKPLSSSLREKKKKLMNGSASQSQGKVKKEEANIDNKKKKKKKVKEEEERKAAAAKQNDRKKERKVFDLPGQKRDPPEERDPLRIFYETLYQQLPSSEMAALWMMESGLLPLGEAKKVYEKKLKRNQEQKKLGSPVKTVASVKKTINGVTVRKTKGSSSPASAKKKSVVESKTVTISVSKKSNKRKSTVDDSDTSENDSDDDFVLAKTKIKKPRAA